MGSSHQISVDIKIFVVIGAGEHGRKHNFGSGILQPENGSVGATLGAS